MKRIGFILDAGQSIGMGHLVRCLTLARFCMTRKVKCVFFYPNGSEVIDIGPRKGPQFEWIALPFGLTDPASMDEWRLLHKEIDFDALVVDLWEHQCHPLHCLQGNRDFLKVLLSGFPFTHQPVFYDVLISPGIFAPNQIQFIKTSLGQVAKYIGPKYVIINEEYVSQAQPVKVRKIANAVLVCMGGADPSNITLRVLSALALYPDIRLEVVIGPNYKYLTTILPYEKPGIRNFHIGIDNIAPLVQSCDIAIITGGILRYEMALAGLPFITISTYPVQNELSQVFADMGGAVNLGTIETVSADTILDEIQQLLQDFERRKEMHQHLLTITDGKGPERIWQILDKHCGYIGSEV